MIRSNAIQGIATSLLLAAVATTALAAEKAADIRKEMAKTEEAYFALYNKLNSDRQYDIVCRREAETGSTFLKRVCKPRYLERVEQAAASERMQSAIQASASAAANSRGPDIGTASAGGTSSANGTLDEGFRRNMLEVLEKSPELRALGSKRDELQARLDAAKK